MIAESQAQRQRERNYETAARRLEAEGVSPTPSSSLQWVSIGPLSALSEWNGDYYNGLDSGRVSVIRQDPNNAKTIFISAIGGGIWKAADITLTKPQWVTITDTLGTLNIGSFDLDPANSSVIHAGLGDFWEGNPGGLMVKTSDGGANWSSPFALKTTLNT